MLRRAFTTGLTTSSTSEKKLVLQDQYEARIQPATERLLLSGPKNKDTFIEDQSHEVHNLRVTEMKQQ